MTPTLNITIQRPSAEALEVVRAVSKGEPTSPSLAIFRGTLEELFPNKLIREAIHSGWITESNGRLFMHPFGTLTLAAYDAEAAGDGGQVEAKGTARCPLCGDDHPHYTANHREDIPFRPEIDWAFESFEEAWVKVLAGPRVWSPNELDRHAGCFGYKDEEVEAKWQIFRVAWLLARGRKDVLPNRD